MAHCVFSLGPLSYPFFPLLLSLFSKLTRRPLPFFLFSLCFITGVFVMTFPLSTYSALGTPSSRSCTAPPKIFLWWFAQILDLLCCRCLWLFFFCGALIDLDPPGSLLLLGLFGMWVRLFFRWGCLVCSPPFFHFLP